VNGAQHLVVAYRSEGGLVEHSETFRTLPVWQAATVVWSAGEGDGSLTVRLDDRTQLELGNLVNGDEVVNELDMGIINSPGASGEAHFDAFHARRESPEAPLLTIDKVRNFSTRAVVGPGLQEVVGGFIIAGDTKKCVILRGRSFTLPLGDVPRADRPNLTLWRIDQRERLGFNDGWEAHPEVERFTLFNGTEIDQSEAGIFACLEPGAYTASFRLNGGSPGVAIVEVVDVDFGSAYLLNISTRAVSESGINRKVGGFIIEGNEPRTVLIRARGQSVPITGAQLMDDPRFDLFSGQSVIASNDNWQDDPNSGAIPANWVPTDPASAALVITLPPGPYTVVVSAASGASGIGIVEVYDIEGQLIEPN
ncbi:MAG: hypothetical protein AAGH19_02860, partial [Pseudomonadota bacterium]